MRTTPPYRAEWGLELEAFECNGMWWLPGHEQQAVAGTLKVAESGAMELKLIAPLDRTHSLFADKSCPVILGSASDSPKGEEITLANSFCTASRFPLSVDGRESYHVGLGYFGAHLSEESCFAFKSMKLRLSGLGEWLYTLSGFDRKKGGLAPNLESGPIGFYTRPQPVRTELVGGTIAIGLGLRSSFSGLRYEFREEGEVKVTSEQPLSVEEFNDRYAYALRSLMTFVSDRAQIIEQFSVWQLHAPKQEIVVIGEWVQPRQRERKKDVSWHEMLFTIKDIDFDHFIKKWFAFTRTYSASCNIYFGLMYGPPAFVDMTFENVANAVHLYYDRTPDGVARKESDERFLTEAMAQLPSSHKDWLVDHLGPKPRPPFRVALVRLLERHDEVMNPLLQGRGGRFVDQVLGTLEYVIRRDPDFELTASYGADLYWLTEKLRFLLKACFLHESGFGSEAIRACFQRNALYRHICQLEDSAVNRRNIEANQVPSDESA